MRFRHLIHLFASNLFLYTKKTLNRVFRSSLLHRPMITELGAESQRGRAKHISKYPRWETKENNILPLTREKSVKINYIKFFSLSIFHILSHPLSSSPPLLSRLLIFLFADKIKPTTTNSLGLGFLSRFTLS